MRVREAIRPGTFRSAGSTTATQGRFITSGGDGGLAVRLRDVVFTEEHDKLLTTTHRRLLLRVIGYHRQRVTYRQISYAQPLKMIGRQSVEAAVRQR